MLYRCGDGQAGFGSGNFYAEPALRMKLRQAGHLLYWGGVACENIDCTSNSRKKT